MSTVSRYWKCIVSFVAPGCVLLVTGATAGAVYSAPNATAEPAAEPSDV